MKTFIYTILNGAEVQIQQPGVFVYLKSSAAELIVTDNVNGFDVPMSQGDNLRVKKQFTALQLKNNSGANITATVVIGDVGEDFTKSPPTSLTVAVSGAIDTLADVALAAASTTLIAAANLSRKEIIISSLITNAQILRIGDVGAGAANGIPLPPGATITIDCTAAVYGFNPGAAVETVAVMEVNV
jgi:hypothetical protein